MMLAFACGAAAEPRTPSEQPTLEGAADGLPQRALVHQIVVATSTSSPYPDVDDATSVAAEAPSHGAGQGNE